jgi:Rps23 Pro-64 3,4-dihydroxylase Tpa1-like proline 4-hydroxylase
MKIEVYKSNDLPIIVIDDFFNNESSRLIWNELLYLNDGTDKMRTAEYTGGGFKIIDNKKVYSKNNIGTVLDKVYLDKSVSNILSETRKIYNKDLVDSLISAHKFFKFITNVNNDSTKVHYFEDGSYYRAHHDASLITVIYYFYKEPKLFEGGDLVFDDQLKIECKNNRCLIFPSILTHEVTTVELPLESQSLGYGRYAISQFMFIEDKNVERC